jgi:homoserine O-acetyltransferase
MSPSRTSRWRHPALQPGWIDRPHQTLELGDFALESGEVIRDFDISYVTHGTRALADDNVILVLTAIGSIHHRLDFLIGPGRPLDTERHFIICADAIGNGMTTSPSNSRTQPDLEFPRFTIRDMVASQHKLLDALGIKQLAAVVGASMGGMQALQWGVSDPLRMRGIVALVPMARTRPWSVAMNEVARRILMADAGWPSGPYGAG